jgi:hypothetical protein
MPVALVKLKLNMKLQPGARGGAVGWGNVLQAGRSWVRFPVVSLEFFTDIIFPGRTIILEVDSASNRNEVNGVKAPGA